MDLSKILKVLNGAESKFLSSENPNTKARRRGRERCPAEENFSTLMRRVDIKDGWLIQEHEVSSALKVLTRYWQGSTQVSGPETELPMPIMSKHLSSAYC
ncbi:hypothetical protein KM043_009663 [Ampulex compressa]|nr:hypothetical protein KM043_009663 [Ampulex compressa]